MTGVLIAALIPVAASGADPLVDLPDPTRPSTAARAAVPGPGPVLQSTLISPLRRLAVIDGKAYATGDRVAGARIIDIRPYEVELSAGNRRSVLRLSPAIVRGAAGKQGD